MPGRNASTVYRPCASVTADRAPSMSAGLEASTVTPGKTAPVVSVTWPAIALCACAAIGSMLKNSDSPTLRSNIGASWRTWT